MLVFKNYQNFLIFYKFYVWLIIHFEFGLNIYLLFDDKNYKNSESFQRIANLMSKLVWNMTAVVLIYSKAEFWHKLIESVSKLKYINIDNNDNTICLKIPFGIKYKQNNNETTTSVRVILIFFMPIICHAIILFTGFKMFKSSRNNDWVNVLDAILLFNLFYT